MEVEFRDGKREIPDHLGYLMASLDTVQMTFEEARDAANRKLVSDRLNEAQSKVIVNHLRRFG